MTRSPIRRTLFVLAFATAIPLAIACKKPPPPTPDAEAAPAVIDSGTLVLAPLDDDAGDAGDAGDGDAGHKWSGPGMNPNEARVRHCCSVLRTRIKALGTAPEVAQLSILVAQCDAIANSVHQNPNAPELNAIKSMPGCQ